LYLRCGITYELIEISSAPAPKICNTILDNIGRTPLVRVDKIAKEAGLKCELCKSSSIYRYTQY
jgi:cystathionine beta-synthase